MFKRVYNLKKNDGKFLKAVRKNIKRHIKKCPEYAKILKERNFSIGDLKTISDICKIPPLPTIFLKNHALYSIKERRLMFKSTTSGTSGKVGKIGFDLRSGLKWVGMIAGTFFYHRLLTLRPANYIILGYQPAKHNKMGAVKTAYGATYTAPARRREYALKDNGAGYDLNIEGLKKALIRYAEKGKPVRFVGFPSYFFFLLNELKDAGIRLKLHKKSLVMLGGGWKQFFSESVDKPALYALSQEVLGIGGDRIKEFFSAVEHPVFYADCKNHRFHVPVYSRVIIRDENLNPLPFGKAGILNFVTPMMTSMPFTSVLTDDLAVMYPGEACGCGIASPYFEVLGRVGLADLKTCAAGAAELLKTGS